MAEHGREQVPKDDAPIFGTGHAGGQYKVGFADGQGFAAYFTGESAPSHEREYGDDAHKDQVRGPFGGQDCAEGHENGNRWKRKDEFDDALDDVVDIAAVIAGDHAECRAEGEADEYGEQADGEGDAAPCDDAREHVASETVGAEEEHGIAFAGAKHVDVGGKEAVECVLGTSRKGVHGVAHRGVFGVGFDTGLQVKRFFDAIDKGPVDAVLREDVDALGGQVYVVVIAMRRIVWGQKFAQKDT